MNIIALSLGDHYAQRAMQKTLEELGTKKLFSITGDLDNDILMKLDCHVESYDITIENRLTFCKGKILDNDRIPIDNDLMEKFSKYFSNATNIYNRLSNGNNEYKYLNAVEDTLNAISYWNTIIVKYNINMFLSHDVPHCAYDYVIYGLCKIYNIPVYFMYPTPVYGYSIISTDVETFCGDIRTCYEKKMLDYKDKDISEISLPEDFEKEYEKFTTFENKDLTPHYMQTFYKQENELQKKKKNVIVRLFEFAIICFKTGIRKNILSWFQYNYSGVKHEAERINDYYAKWESVCKKPDFNNKYIYLPLHYQPEATSCPIGGIYKNQELVAGMLSKYVPDDVYIYVKENPKQIAWHRTHEFVDTLANLRNVILVPKDCDTYKLIDNCIAVASLTGTAMWEGIWKNKPGLMFGYFVTQHAPGIYTIRSTKDCEKAITDILDPNIDTNIPLKNLKIFLLALSETSFKGGINRHTVLGKEHIEQERVDAISNAFLKEISKG